jgi:hypothetical protein
MSKNEVRSSRDRSETEGRSAILERHAPSIVKPGALLSLTFVALATVVAGCVGEDPDATDGSSSQSESQKFSCTWTESSSYKCADSNGSNPDYDTCSDAYKSLDECKTANKGAQETSGDGVDMCLYRRDTSNFQWTQGACASKTASGTSSSSTSSGAAPDAGSSSSSDAAPDAGGGP